jgi:HEAT repeat protein
MRRALLTLLAVGLLACCSSGFPADEADELRAADEKLLQDNGITPDAAGLLEFYRKRTPGLGEQRRLEALVRQLASEQFEERERATKELKACGEAALPALRQAALDADVEVSLRARDCITAIEGPGLEQGLAAARTLARRAPPTAVGTLLAYLPHAYDPVVEDAVCDALAVLASRPGPVEPALLAALTEASPVRRGAAAFALGRRPEESTRTAVRRLLADGDRRVRLRATQGLLAACDRSAVPALLDLAAGPQDDLTWQAEAILQQLAGESTPSPLPDDVELLGRTRRRAAWQNWWREHGQEVDLATLAEKPRLQNVTLVPEMHANRVWECGKDGQPRWEVPIAGCPIDAQVLPGKRLLVAELNAHQVTERDFKGNILWKFALDTPIACQRLVNGHTWMSTNHKWLVVDRDGKEIVSYAPENGFFIHSVQRQPNGHVVMVSMSGVVREVTAKGTLVRDVTLPIQGGWSGVESAPGGHYLACNLDQGKVLEVDAMGTVVWDYQTAGACYAQRLPNGNTLVVSNNTGLIELDRNKNVVWKQGLSTSLWRAHRR